MVNIDGENKKVVGIIVECNPFHKGHARLIKECKKQGDFIVAVMSGNFVQRGEPAVYDKYKRTSELIKGGVDLVIELPIEYVLSSAKYFASAGVRILNDLGFVDYIMFGSKIGDIDELKKLASIDIEGVSYNSPVHVKGSYNSPVQKLLKEGKSYAAAIGEILGKKLSSNDILAIEYIRALNEIKSDIKPLTIKRKDDLPTASKLREKIKKKITCDSFSNILNYKLLLAKGLRENAGESILSDIYLMTRDMENAILNSISNKKDMKNLSFTERAMKIKTKNVTLAYIKRLFFNIIFDIRKSDVGLIKAKDSNLQSKENGNTKNEKLKKISFVRILGFGKDSSILIKRTKVPALMSFAPSSYKDYLSKYKKTIKQPIYKNKKGEFTLFPILQKNIFANDLYYFLSGQKFCEAERQVVVL